MATEPRYDFPAVSNGEAKTPEAGKTFEENLFQYDETRDWTKSEHGLRIGRVLLTYPKAPVKPKRVEAAFEFDNRETVTYEGPIPGNGSWKGRGGLQFQRGSGKFKDRGDEIEVDSVNPKRWG
jgi:hypothetical protein